MVRKQDVKSMTVPQKPDCWEKLSANNFSPNHCSLGLASPFSLILDLLNFTRFNAPVF